MRRTFRWVLLYSVLAISLISQVAQAQPLTHIWSLSAGGTRSDTGWRVAVDNWNNVVVIGSFQNIADFGGGVLTSAGSNDIFLAKYDFAGNHAWSKRFGDTGWDEGRGVAVDAGGNIVVVGYFEGSADFGGGVLTSAGSNDIFVAKYDPAGNHLWSKVFGSTDYEEGINVSIDGGNNIFVTGFSYGSIDFGGGVLTNAGSGDSFILKLDSAGSHVWSSYYGGGGNELGWTVMVDGNGYVNFTGSFDYIVDFGGGPLAAAGLGGYYDVFLVQFDAAGNHRWSKRFGDATHDEGLDLDIDADNNIVVTGYCSGTVDFGGGPLVDFGGNDIYVAKFDNSGTHLWSKRFGNTGTDLAWGVEVGTCGNLCITGVFGGTVDFGAGPLSSAGSGDIFLAMFDAENNPVWSDNFGSTGNDVGLGVAIDGTENVIMTGQFSGTVDFGGGALNSAGQYDIFVLKLGSQPVATRLADFFTRNTERGIQVVWRLAELDSEADFFIYRALGDGSDFYGIGHSVIEDINGTYCYIDGSCKPGMTYRYRVVVSDEDGRRILFETEAVTADVYSIVLEQNFPNPFNPSTTISFELNKEAEITLAVYDASGRLIRVLESGNFGAQRYNVDWDGTDADKRPVASGVYFYRLAVGNTVMTRKAILLK